MVTAPLLLSYFLSCDLLYLYLMFGSQICFLFLILDEAMMIWGTTTWTVVTSAML